MAKKKEGAKKDEKATKEAKAEKRKARMEALKNRPEGQRPNSKQIEVITIGENKVVKTFGQVVKAGKNYCGVLVTSVVEVEGNPVSSSVTFVPGKLTIKVKKGHGNIVKPKSKGGNNEAEEMDQENED